MESLSIKIAINGISPNDIEDVDILKGEAAIKTYGDSAKNGVLLVYTIKYEIASFQEKLCMFSKEYKDYIKINPTAKIIYVINGDTSKRSLVGVASIFRSTPRNEFISVDFQQIKNGNPMSKPPILSITTKQ